jgi:SagB-type dehydrogenase family enzyme
MRAYFTNFLTHSSVPGVSTSAQEEGAPQPPLELPYPPDADLIALPAPDHLAMPVVGLREAIEKRRSLRRYQETPLSLEELSYLLWLTQGVQRVTGRPATLRTVPSAGARHAFETVLLVNRVTGLEPGLYRFIATRHALMQMEAPADIRERLTRATHEQEHVRLSAVTFAWAAITERMAWRYSERSMRYLFLDAGHVCQNLYLAAESIDCGVCAVGHFLDDELNELLGLDGVDQFVLYLATVGKR